jgi:hypothetical protein
LYRIAVEAVFVAEHDGMLQGMGTKAAGQQARISHRITATVRVSSMCGVQFPYGWRWRSCIGGHYLHMSGSEWGITHYLYVDVSGRRVVLIEPGLSELSTCMATGW